jgi:hypothetical protein
MIFVCYWWSVLQFISQSYFSLPYLRILRLKYENVIFCVDLCRCEICQNERRINWGSVRRELDTKGEKVGRRWRVLLLFPSQSILTVHIAFMWFITSCSRLHSCTKTTTQLRNPEHNMNALHHETLYRSVTSSLYFLYFLKVIFLTQN